MAGTTRVPCHHNLVVPLIMFNLPLQKQQYYGPLITIVAAFVLFFLGSVAESHLPFSRSGVENGEWWRFITGNWLHSNVYHLLLNCAGVFLLWALHGDYYRTSQYFLMLTLYSLMVTVCLYHYDPSMTSYVGLSGALHGLFTWGALQDIKSKTKGGWLLLIGVWLKIIHEQFSAPNESLASLIDARVAIDAHLYGAMAGMLWFVIVTLINLRAKRED